MKKSFLSAAIYLLSISLICLAACSRKDQTPLVQETTPQTKIDYDLSAMNYNMLSSITFDMLVEPEKYADKTIKMSGLFYSQIHEGKRYFSVIVWDATKCCPAGMDFIPPALVKYPDDFPQQEQNITVIGKLKLNEDNSIDFDAQTMEF